jgi:hypothetical protein
MLSIWLLLVLVEVVATGEVVVELADCLPRL